MAKHLISIEYAPTLDSSDEVIEAFYNDIEKTRRYIQSLILALNYLKNDCLSDREGNTVRNKIIL